MEVSFKLSNNICHLYVTIQLKIRSFGAELTSFALWKYIILLSITVF